MKFLEITREIAAPPERVWSILSDGQALAANSLGVMRIDGQIAPGSRFALWSDTAPDRAFPTRVLVFTPPTRMVWEGGLPLGLFRGVRQFNLSPLASGTAFHMREEFSGLMLPLIWPSMPDLTGAFQKFADGLKKLSEARADG